LNQPLPPPQAFDLRIHPERPLVIVDVDEVLGLLLRGFEAFITGRGFELRVERYGLFENIFRPGEAEHLDIAEGRRLFDAYFDSDSHMMDVAPGATETLDQLSRHASIVVLTNAPAASRPVRARWLVEKGLLYPLVMGAGPKGRAVAAMAARTRGAAVFVDDLVANLDSAERAAPAVHRFQSVADERLRPLAPSAPDRHPRYDEWPALGDAIRQALRIAPG
jgi:hypothetical protein